MAIDVNSEELLTFAQARERIPGRVDLSTVFRWSQRGVRGVKLESALLGGKRFTSAQALQRFSDALSNADGAVDMSTLRARMSAHARAEKDLDAAGI